MSPDDQIWKIEASRHFASTSQRRRADTRPRWVGTPHWQPPETTQTRSVDRGRCPSQYHPTTHHTRDINWQPCERVTKQTHLCKATIRFILNVRQRSRVDPRPMVAVRCDSLIKRTRDRDETRSSTLRVQRHRRRMVILLTRVIPVTDTHHCRTFNDTSRVDCSLKRRPRKRSQTAKSGKYKAGSRRYPRKQPTGSQRHCL
jgi:hypothetical protein